MKKYLLQKKSFKIYWFVALLFTFTVYQPELSYFLTQFNIYSVQLNMIEKKDIHNHLKNLNTRYYV